MAVTSDLDRIIVEARELLGRELPKLIQEMMKIAGEIKAAYTQKDSIAVGDAEGHVLSLAISEGPNVSTAEHEFMEGATVLNYSFNDLVGGTQGGFGPRKA